MSVFGAALAALNLTNAEAAELLPGREPGQTLKRSMVEDFARGKSRVPPDVWHRLGDLFEAVEAAADEIIADQGERDGGGGLLQLVVDVDAIDLPHRALREAAMARAMLVLGPQLLTPAAPPR